MKENINCISHPFKEGGDSPDFPTIYLHEGHMLAEDVPLGGNVVLRNLEYGDYLSLRDVREPGIDTFIGGGFSVKKWLSKNEDGSEKLQHYHVEFMPQFDDDARNFIDNRLRRYERTLRSDKAYALSEELPKLRICPDMGIALVNSDTAFMTIDGEGTVRHNKTRHLSLWPDRKDEKTYFRFGVYTSDIIDSATEQEYRIVASGAIIAERQDAIKKRLDSLVDDNNLNPKAMNEIAQLAISISQK